MKASTKLAILEAMMKLGPAPGYRIHRLAKVPRGSAYVSLVRMEEEGLCRRLKEPQEKLWKILEPGKLAAKALRNLSDSEEAF